MKCRNKRVTHFIIKMSLAILYLLIVSDQILAQDGEKGLNEATELVKKYFTIALKLLYAVGGIVGVVGAVKVYNKMSSGEQDANRVAAAWFGACLFLVVVATALRTFFGL